MTTSAIRLAVALAGLSFSYSAEAACTIPLGTYVGSAAGLGVISNPNISPTQYGAMFLGNSWSVTFYRSTASSGSRWGRMVSFGKAVTDPVPQYNLKMTSATAGSITFTNGDTPKAVLLSPSYAKINSFSNVTGNPVNLMNFFNTRTCMGIISASVVIDNQSYPATWVITSSNSGSTITLLDRSTEVNFGAFTIQLQKI